MNQDLLNKIHITDKDIIFIFMNFLMDNCIEDDMFAWSWFETLRPIFTLEML